MNRGRTWPGAAVAATLALGAALPPAAAQELTPERQRQIVREALTSLDGAVNTQHDNAVRAAEQYRRSAAAFEALADAGFQNVAIFYNLGNVYYRLGDLGRAIANYRRALRLGPADPRVQANLRLARNRVVPLIEPGEAPWHHAALLWHTRTTPASRRIVAWSASVIGAVLLMARARRRSSPLLVGGVLLALLGAGAAASLAWQVVDEQRRPHAVVVRGEPALRVGRGEGYDAALKQPLGPGVELRILQQQGDWVECRLPNGVTGWLPASAVERI